MVVPSVAQQLAAIRHTIAKTVMPALAADADFAREQAGLVLASLDWAVDVVESEHRYELVEHADQRGLLASLVELGPDDAVGAHALLDATTVVPPDLATLREHTRDLKRATEAAFASLTGDGAASATRARELMSGVARRQTARELAWARMTGFPKGVPGDVASVLAEQARDRPA